MRSKAYIFCGKPWFVSTVRKYVYLSSEVGETSWPLHPIQPTTRVTVGVCRCCSWKKIKSVATNRFWMFVSGSSNLTANTDPFSGVNVTGLGNSGEKSAMMHWFSRVCVSGYNWKIVNSWSCRSNLHSPEAHCVPTSLCGRSAACRTLFTYRHMIEQWSTVGGVLQKVSCDFFISGVWFEIIKRCSDVFPNNRQRSTSFTVIKSTGLKSVGLLQTSFYWWCMVL